MKWGKKNNVILIRRFGGEGSLEGISRQARNDKYGRWGNYIILGVLVGMCVIRAGVQVRRMATEQPTSFHPEITVCSQKPTDMEGAIVWNFRNLGVVCTK